MDELRRTLEVIATSTRATVFHCKSGKDRTGIVAALVLSLLGVAGGDIIADFALTELATDHLIAEWRATHPGPRTAMAVLRQGTRASADPFHGRGGPGCGVRPAG
ncbi:Tyrosine-protein phosphatase precursor [Mycobacterium tuberculosis]|nr:Tyrosine-protein phosphatase precursor [Mycobacterium tuberculosis]